MNPKHWLALAALAFAAASASALDIVPYEANAFAKARAAGQVTALEFHSGWCPICVLQDRGVRELKDGKSFENVTVFVVDFIKEADLRQRYNVTTFATLVVFRGNDEKARAVGEFQAEKLRQVFDKAL